MNYSLGFHVPLLVPKEAGPDYTPSYYLEPLQAYRQDFTVFSSLIIVSHHLCDGLDRRPGQKNSPAKNMVGASSRSDRLALFI